MPIKKPALDVCNTKICIGYLLRQAGHALRVNVDHALKKFNITHPQFSVLKTIESEPGLHAADIARMCLLSPQAVNTIIVNLETAKLIQRSPHAIHRKVIEISLTDLGKKRLAQCKRIVGTIVEKKLLTNVKPAEEKIIRTWLAKCIHTAGID